MIDVWPVYMYKHIKTRESGGIRPQKCCVVVFVDSFRWFVVGFGGELVIHPMGKDGAFSLGLCDYWYWQLMPIISKKQLSINC